MELISDRRIYGANNQDDYRHNYVEFSLQPVENRDKSIKAGHPVYDEKEWCKVVVPGGMINEGEVTPTLRERYRERYDAWKAESAEPISGMSITLWPGATPGQALTLKGLQIHTVESLADASDTILDRYGMGGRELRDKARIYVKGATEVGTLAEALAATKVENEALKDENGRLKSMIELIRQEILKPRQGRTSQDIKELQELVQ